MFINSNCYALDKDYYIRTDDIEIQYNEIIDDKSVYYDVLKDEGGISLYSTSLPTSGLNLGLQSYKATIVEAVQRWVYTNVYFTVGSNKRIVIDYSFTSTNGDVADIGLYDMTTNSWVDQTTGLVGTWTKTNLNNSHKYVVAFKGHTNPLRVTKISGTAIITN